MEDGIFKTVLAAFVAVALIGISAFFWKINKQSDDVFTLSCGGRVVSVQIGWPQRLTHSGSYVFDGGSYRPGSSESCSLLVEEK